MAKGKQTCKILKEIRKQIATENDIQLVIEECTYQGDCKGTCPKCEAEVRYLERELEKRQRLGKVAMVAGLSVGLMAASQTALAQQPDTLKMDTLTEEETKAELFGLIQETRPSFRGGERELSKFITSNLVYPQEAKSAGVEGQILVEFYIEKDGTVTDAKVLKGIGYGCDEEALRVVGLMPKWRPCKVRGESMRVRQTLPITFVLGDKH
jgi:TonB family protein